MRRGLTVEAGVEVTGTVQKPRVRLVSTPELPEAEKLRKKAERIYEEKEKYEKQEQQVSEEDIALMSDVRSSGPKHRNLESS